MPVLTVASGKGGVGKTVVATCIAGALAAEGLNVALLDADPNGGSVRWATSIYEGPALASYAEPDTERLTDLLPALTDKHEVLICDTAGFQSKAGLVCVGAADAVLIPASPGEGDLAEARKMVSFVRGTAKNIRRDIELRVLANRIRRGTTLSRHLLSEIDRLELPRLETTFSEAVAFGELGFASALPATGQAAQEIAALIAELRALGWLPRMPIHVAA